MRKNKDRTYEPYMQGESAWWKHHGCLSPEGIKALYDALKNSGAYTEDGHEIDIDGRIIS